MPTDSKSRNWFDGRGTVYARFRPAYPADLTRFLAESSPSHDRAVDIGCGNGQLTRQLADHFDEVIGLDSSADQIANARARDGVRYLCAPAERLPLPDHCANLITAAQAAHWFDLAVFYAEARRVARDDAMIALVSYGVPRLPDELHGRFERFYHDEIGPYWPPERRLVDNGYRGISFPFAEFEAPALDIRMSWQLDDFLGYISTWSAVQRLFDAGQNEILTTFGQEISALWGEPTTKRLVAWPINMRAGRI